MVTTTIPAGTAADASFHLVNYSAGAGFASIHCATTVGTIRISVNAGETDREFETRPLSPIYSLNNAACGQNVSIPLERNRDRPETASVTFVNDSQTDEGEVTIVVGVSFLPEKNQEKLAFKRKLPARASTFFHIVFNRVD